MTITPPQFQYHVPQQASPIAPIVPAPPRSNVRRRVVTGAVVLLVVGGFAVGGLYTKSLADDLTRTRGNLSSTRADLSATRVTLESKSTELSETESKLSDTETELSDTRSQLEEAQAQADAARTCAAGVAASARYLLRDDYTSALSALEGVQSECDAAVEGGYSGSSSGWGA